jgi:RHS repeat-associated protein
VAGITHRPHSTDALVNDHEFTTDRYMYRAFGLEINTESGGRSRGANLPNPLPMNLGTAAPGTEMTYVGRQGYVHDREFDLYFLSSRYYDWAPGRFVSEDRIGYDGGDVNLYRYAKNNPVNGTDPSGQYIISPNRSEAEAWSRLLRGYDIENCFASVGSGRTLRSG